jgi:hypothetical protein
MVKYIIEIEVDEAKLRATNEDTETASAGLIEQEMHGTAGIKVVNVKAV